MRRPWDILATAIVRNPLARLTETGVIVAVGLALALSRRLNHDVGWLLVATNHLLDGAAIYVDEAVEINPPLILYLFAPAVGLARFLALPEIPTVHAWVGLVGVISLAACARMLALQLEPRDRPLGWLLLPAIAFVYFLSVDAHFGQREHFMLMLLTPYTLSIAARAASSEIPRGDALWVGGFAGLGFALKPHYLLLLFVLEVALLSSHRRAGRLVRTELVALTAVGLLYGLSVVVATPAYLQIVLPLGLDAYWAYQQPVGALLHWRELALIAVAGISLLVVWRQPTLRALGTTFFLAGITCHAAYLVQGTGYAYQRYPTNGIALLLGVLAAGSLVLRLPRETGAARLPGRLAGATASGTVLLGLLLLTPSIRQDLRGPDVWRAGGSRGAAAELVRLIDTRAPGGRVYVLSTRLRAAFPALNYSGAHWASRYSHTWLLPAVVRAERGDPETPARLTAERIEELERHQIDGIVRDLERHKPELLIVDRRTTHRQAGEVGDLRERFSRDPRFAGILQHYRFVERVGTFDVGERID
jgi:hypothetical protein